MTHARGHGRPDIVVVVVDTLRPDHLGCYGYGLPTSPEIDALAAESVVFDRAFAAGIPTSPSFTTLYTGLHPYRHGVVAHLGARRLSPEIRLLSELAQRAGYVTVGIDNLVAQGEGRGSWFARGYDYYSGYIYRPGRDQDALLTERALDFVREYAGAPLFLLVHLWSPHTPYGPLPPNDTAFYRPGTGAHDLAEVRAIHPEYYEAFLRDNGLEDVRDYARIVGLYDGEIRQADEQVGRIVGALRQRRRWDDALFVLMSDHGEAFGEGGLHFDHHGLADAVTRVALVIKAPGVTPARAGDLASTEDLLPTLAELAGLPLPPYDLTGTSLAPLLWGEPAETRSYVVSSEATRQASLSLRTRDWRLVLPLAEDARGAALPNFYGRERDPAPRLYDVRAAAPERDASWEHPAVLAELLAELDRWRAGMAETTGEPDPPREQGLSLPYARFMERILARR